MTVIGVGDRQRVCASDKIRADQSGLFEYAFASTVSRYSYCDRKAIHGSDPAVDRSVDQLQSKVRSASRADYVAGRSFHHTSRKTGTGPVRRPETPRHTVSKEKVDFERD